MKSTFFIIALAVCVYTAKAQNSGTGLKKYELKGKVKQITDLIYFANKENIDTVQYPEKTIMEFGENGNVTQEAFYNRKGILTGKIVYNYMVNNTMVINYYDGKDSLESQSTDKFDQNGFEIEYNHRDAEGGMTRYLFKNNKQGQKTEQQTYVKGDMLNIKIVYKWDKNGHKTEEDHYRPDGVKISHRMITDDTLKNSRHSETYNSKGDMIDTDDSVEKIPDHNGNWQIKEYKTFKHTVNAGDYYTAVLIKRKIEYY